jgi:hypothetical protein
LHQELTTNKNRQTIRSAVVFPRRFSFSEISPHCTSTAKTCFAIKAPYVSIAGCQTRFGVIPDVSKTVPGFYPACNQFCIRLPIACANMLHTPTFLRCRAKAQVVTTPSLRRLKSDF